MTYRPARSIFGFTARVLLVALAAGAGSPAVAQSFTLMGWPSDGGPNGVSYATGLSADGRSASGYSISNVGRPGFVWTADGGRNDFGRALGSGLTTFAFGISGDGFTVVGRGENATTSLAFARSQAGEYHELGTLPGFQFSEARDANFDGSVVVGTLTNGSGSTNQAFRWTQSGGMQGLGVGTTGEAVSGDGSTVVGTLSTQPLAMRWTASGGAQQLPSLGGAGASHARAVNFDGSIIVGNSGVGLRATVWNNGIPTELLPGMAGSVLTPFGVSDNGSVVGGQIQGPGGSLFAGIWTPTTGLMPLSDYLTANGVQIPAGFSLFTCSAVSADGLTFSGWGNGPTPNINGWVATIPAPGTVVILALGGVISSRRRRHNCRA